MKNNNISGFTVLALFAVIGLVLGIIVNLEDSSRTVDPTQCPGQSYVISANNPYMVYLIDRQYSEAWPARCREGEWDRDYYDVQEHNPTDVAQLIKVLPCKTAADIQEGSQGQLIWTCSSE